MKRIAFTLKRSPKATWNRSLKLLSCALFATTATANLWAGSVYVPNGSFESPSTVYVDVQVDSWQKSATPVWYDPSANGPWEQLMGVFLNTPVDSPNNDHIVNCDQAQAAYLFAMPGSALSQDLTAQFEAGKNYNLTVAVLGNGGSMPSGSPLAISFYYRDSANNPITVATTTVTNSATLFPDRNHFVDFSVTLRSSGASDLWIGKNIGIQIASEADFTLKGGYWDIDNVRVTDSIAVPNYSFESPTTTYVDTTIQTWQKSAKPSWFDESSYGPWSQLTGVFLNTPVDSQNNDHIFNLDQSQAAFLFAMPGVALSQDNLNTSNAFNTKFEVGKAYQLTMAVLGNGGSMANGATLLIGLYYLDANTNAVPVASTIITNSSSLFPNRTNFVDFAAELPAVKATDAWAGKNIGIQILSIVDFTLGGGYWDLDNVRLTSTQAPVLSAVPGAIGQINLTLATEPGQKYQVLTSTNVASADWVSLATVTNTTGKAMITDSGTSAQRFYKAKQLP